MLFRRITRTLLIALSTALLLLSVVVDGASFLIQKKALSKVVVQRQLQDQHSNQRHLHTKNVALKSAATPSVFDRVVFAGQPQAQLQAEIQTQAQVRPQAPPSSGSTSTFLHPPPNPTMEETAAASTRSSSLSKYGYIHRIKDPQDFVNFLRKDNRLVVVKVGANWCKFCTNFNPKWRQLANHLSDQFIVGQSQQQQQEEGLVRFAEIEFTENEELCRGLQATKLPHILVFRQGGSSSSSEAETAGMGLLEKFQCGPAYFQKVVDTLNHHLNCNTNSNNLRAQEEKNDWRKKIE